MELSTKQTEFLDVLEKTLGNVSTALLQTRTPREDFDDWMDNFLFKSRYDEIQEKTIDFVENRLIQKINEGDLQAITFFLKTKGKNRGYV